MGLIPLGIMAAAIVLAGCSTKTPATIPLDSLDQFECFDAAIWSVDNNELIFTEGSTYKPPHASPRAIALFQTQITDSYVIECQAMQTGRDYGHRDLCIFFDWQDPIHFGYVHMATQADLNSHHIQIVDGQARTPTTSFRTHGVDWGRDTWHDVRIERNIHSGAIRAYFDDELVLEATDTRFGGGRVGFGSFDDQGRFRSITLKRL